MIVVISSDGILLIIDGYGPGVNDVGTVVRTTLTSTVDGTQDGTVVGTHDGNQVTATETIALLGTT